LIEFKLNSKTMEPLLELSQRLLSYKLAELAFRGVRREDPNSVFLEASLDQIADVRDLFTIYEQIEASDSTTNRDALARLEFLLGENYDNKGEYLQAQTRYERVLFEYPNTIWAPKSAINIAGVCELMGDSARAHQALQLVVDNFPDTRYADRARGELGLPLPERPANFYLDELMAYSPPRIQRQTGPAEGVGPGGRPVPGQESWLQMRRRLYWQKYGSAAGGGA
jgi:tetratricopeptide (TPR) repeat protein